MQMVTVSQNPDENAVGEYDVEEAEEEVYYTPPPSRFSFRVYLLTALVSLAVVAGALYVLWTTMERGQIDRLRYVLRDVRLLPEAESVLPSAGEGFRIYYTRDGIKLTPYMHSLASGVTPHERHRLILREVLSPPPPGPFEAVVPPETELRGFYIVGRTAYIDLSQEFVEPESPSPLAERLAVYGIVNALVLNSPDVDAVQILVEGEPIETAWGWLDTSSPLGANLGTIEEL